VVFESVILGASYASKVIKMATFCVGQPGVGRGMSPAEWAKAHRANALEKCHRAWRDAQGVRPTMATYCTATDTSDRDGFIAARVDALFESFSAEELEMFSSPAPQEPIIPDFTLEKPILATFVADLPSTPGAVKAAKAAYEDACKAHKAEYDAWLAAGDAAFGLYEANRALWTRLQDRVASTTTEAACAYARSKMPQPTAKQQDKPVNKGLVVLDFGIPEDAVAAKAAAKELKEAKRLAALRPATIAAAPAAAGGSHEPVSTAPAPADFVAGTEQSELASHELVSTAPASADFVAGTLQSELASPELVSTATASADFVAGTPQSELASPEPVSTATASADFVAGTPQSELAPQRPPYTPADSSAEATFNIWRNSPPVIIAAAPAAAGGSHELVFTATASADFVAGTPQSELAPQQPPAPNPYRQRGGRGKGGRPHVSASAGGGSTPHHQPRTHHSTTTALNKVVNDDKWCDYTLDQCIPLFDIVRRGTEEDTILKSVVRHLKARAANIPQRVPKHLSVEQITAYHEKCNSTIAAVLGRASQAAQQAAPAAELSASAPQALTAEQLQMAFQSGVDYAAQQAAIQHQATQEALQHSLLAQQISLGQQVQPTWQCSCGLYNVSTLPCCYVCSSPGPNFQY